MTIETIMFFALGALCAALLCLMIMPAVWRRAVRLTKKRIEAATPMSVSEFAADKDQLRAQFALSTRKLEMTVESLRKRVADQLGDINRKRTELAVLKNEREQHQSVVRDIEAREAEARKRILEVERESAELAQRLRARERELATTLADLEAARDTGYPSQYRPPHIEGLELTGDYAHDIDELAAALAVEQRRTGFLENQARALIAQLQSGKTDAPTALGSRTPASDAALTAGSALAAAEARLANAESRLSALLDQAGGEPSHREIGSLAEEMGRDDRLAGVQSKVKRLERVIAADWNTDRAQPQAMRTALIDIASGVAELVYAAPRDPAPQSLFDRVQQFAQGETIMAEGEPDARKQTSA